MVKTYYRPGRADEALKLIADANDKNVLLAGGTTLALNPRGVDGLVDLAALNLSYIHAVDGSLRIGATTPIREIHRSEPVRQFAQGILAESAQNYLTALIRNRATIGGVLAAGNFWADFVTVLVALNASVKIWMPADTSGRTMPAVAPLEDLILKGVRKTLGGGILHEIEIPVCVSANRCGYNRLAKVETDISILSAAAKITMAGSTIQSARLVIGNGLKPVRLKAAEDKVKGMTPANAADCVSRMAREIPADSDIRASAEYRKEVAGVLAGRLIQKFK